jgi:putative membrane protein
VEGRVAVAGPAFAGIILALAPVRAAAHDPTAPLTPDQLWTVWASDPLAAAFVLGVGGLYAAGLTRLWGRAGRGRGIRFGEAACFAGGLVALAAALVSPLHALGATLFTAHMAQHMVLMVVAAPLLVLGSPGVAALWAMPESWRRGAGATLRRPGLQRAWRMISTPMVAWTVHGAALWLWHAPRLYERTVEQPWVHAAQHASFLLAALLFWWVAFRGRGGRRHAAGVSLIYIFTTAVHASVLGALITFSGVVWYPVYGERAALWGLDALGDQQLGGLIMWVPAGIAYVAAFLARFRRWVGDAPAWNAAGAGPLSAAAPRSH